MKYTKAPLPFQGQKKRWIREIAEIAKDQRFDTFVDVFGGSGLVAHTIKQARPDAHVIYNDFDDYTERLDHIGETNAPLSQIREEVVGVPRKSRIPDEVRSRIKELITVTLSLSGYVDTLTLGASLLFSGSNAASVETLMSEVWYNSVIASGYCAEGYLEGVDTMRVDFRYALSTLHSPSTLFVLDPPYLQTDMGGYQIRSTWRLGDTLDLVTAFPGLRAVLFSSRRSDMLQLLEWHTGKHFKTLVKAGVGVNRSGVSDRAKYDDFLILNN